ncbi:hypothetical protein CXB51_033494 [Gossypium anomalum]|uniref:Maspardin n=1 Tax=Gossypium anomalum TaxID=47600 RepID=A0A8J5Y4C6_9ROSI|nr:hypothetical protein CXB51_033494 [Gossypium anomalum]
MKGVSLAPGDYIHFKSQVPLHKIPLLWSNYYVGFYENSDHGIAECCYGCAWNLPNSVLCIFWIGTKQWRYYDFGPKVVSPLICLPGIAGTADIYYKQIMSLSMKGYRVISVDIPQVWNHQEWIQSFEKFLDVINVHHIHLYGTSLGGFLAQLFAQHRPRRVKSLILSNAFLETCSFAAAMPWAPIVGWSPSFLLKRYVLTGIRDGPHEPFIADSVDFVVSQVETLSRDDLASRLTLTVDTATVEPLLLSDSFITIMDEVEKTKGKALSDSSIVDMVSYMGLKTNDYSAIPQQLKDQLSERYPGAKRAYLKTGGDFSFLSRPDEVNLHLQLHLRQVGVEARPDLVQGIPRDGTGGSPSKENDKKKDPDDQPKDNGGIRGCRTATPPTSAPRSSSSPALDESQFCRVVQSFPKHDTVKLTDETFVQWKHQLTLIIEAYGLTDYIHGMISAPSKFVHDAEGKLVPNSAFLLFQQQDKLLASWILSTISGEFLSSFTGTATAHDVWSKACSLFGAASGAKISRLKHELYSVKKGHQSVKEYLGQIKKICDLLAASGHPVSAEEHTNIVLAGLSQDFDSVVTAASFSPEPLALDRLMEILLECERRQQRFVTEVLPQANLVQQSSPSGSALGVSVSTPTGSSVAGSFSPGNRGSFRGRGRGNRGRPQCQICGRIGHLAQRCYYRFDRSVDGPPVSTIGPSSLSFSSPSTFYPASPTFASQPWHFGRGSVAVSNPFSPSEFPSNFGPYSTNPNVPPGSSSGPDSCGLFTPGHTRPVHMGSNIPAAHHVVGPASWSSKASLIGPAAGLEDQGASGSDLQPRNYDEPYIPVPVNSVAPPCGILIRAPLTTSVKKRPRYITPLIIQDLKTQETLLLGHTHEGLYRFSLNQKQSAPNGKSTVLTAELDSTSSMIPATELFELWYRRLGHPSSTVVNSVLKACNISVPSNKISRICTACQQGKSHKLPFSPSTTVYTCPFELVVSDLWGPAAINCGNSWYYIAFIDLQSDWGGEFRLFTSFLSQHGIIHRVTCPHTSEQNGVVERKHRHIVEVGLTLLAQAHLPLKYWGFAFTYAVHLINRLPTLFCTINLCTRFYMALSRPTIIFEYSDATVQSTKATNVLPLMAEYLCPDMWCLMRVGFFFLKRTYMFLQQQAVSLFVFLLFNHGAPSHPMLLLPTVHGLHLLLCRPVLLNLLLQIMPMNTRVKDNVTSSPTPIFSTTIVDPPPLVENTYPMVTRPKVGIFKPEVLVAELCEQEPRTIDDAFASPEWKKSAQDDQTKSQWYCGSPKGSRLVAKGCSQMHGCDFRETFSPVVKHATIRTILSIVVTKGWPLRQIDVNNAFLNGDLTEEVYIGFVFSKSDASLFIQITDDFRMYVLVYVDDIIIIGDSSSEIDTFVHRLHSEFSLKYLGPLHYFLGIEVHRSSVGELHLCQKKYILDLLDQCRMIQAKGVPTPMYVVLTRPDIAYAVNRICQFMHAPTDVHLVALKLILRYLRATVDYGLLIRPSTRLSLVGYADANWGLDFDDRRSTTGYYVSFAEAEYRGLAAAAADVTWLESLLKELRCESVDTPTIWCDNSSAVAVAANLVLHSKFKHVELDLFFVREKVAHGSLIVGEVPACDQVADIFTKPLSASKFCRLRNLLRVSEFG